MNCVVFPTASNELGVIWSGQLRNKHLPLGEVNIRGLTPLHRSLPSDINVSSWVSRQSWESSVPDELQYMLVTYKTVGYKEKVYQSCSLSSTVDGKDNALMRSFAQHLASERDGVGYASFDSRTHMILIPRSVRTNEVAKAASTAASSRSVFHVLICYEPLLDESKDDTVVSMTAKDGDNELESNNEQKDGSSANVEIAIESQNEESNQYDSHVQQDCSHCSTVNDCNVYGSYVDGPYVYGSYVDDSYVDGTYVYDSYMDGSYDGSYDVDYYYKDGSDVDDWNVSRGNDLKLYWPRSNSYCHQEQEISFYPMEEEQDGLGAMTPHSDENAANEKETPLLASLRSVLDAVKHRQTQDSDTFSSVGYERVGDMDHETTDEVRWESVDKRHSWSPSSLSEDDQDTDVSSSHPSLQLFRSCSVQRRKSDHAVNRPPRGGFASCYRATKVSKLAVNMSRYLINTSTRLRPTSRPTRKHVQHTSRCDADS